MRTTKKLKEMKIKISEIEDLTLALLDENAEAIEERVEYGDAGTELRGLIRSLLPEASRLAVCSASRADIDEVKEMEGVIAEHYGDGQAVVKLPEDYLRLIYFRMSDWPRGVTEPLAADGDSLALRLGRSWRMFGRRATPAVAVAHSGHGRSLRVLGTIEGSTVAEAQYVPVPQVENGYIELPSRLMHPVAARLAEMVNLITTH